MCLSLTNISQVTRYLSTASLVMDAWCPISTDPIKSLPATGILVVPTFLLLEIISKMNCPYR